MFLFAIDEIIDLDHLKDDDGGEVTEGGAVDIVFHSDQEFVILSLYSHPGTKNIIIATSRCFETIYLNWKALGHMLVCVCG